MSRLIDADKLKKDVLDLPDCYNGFSDTYDKACIIGVIDEQPIIKPKKGKWIPVTKIYKVTEEQFPKTHIEWVDATEPDEIDGVRCSECGTVYDFIEARNWCSECGADMRGET